MKLLPFYDDPEFDYQKYWQERNYENQADQIALKKLLKLIPNKEKIIDIGAGFGRLTPVYQNQFKKIVLVDPSLKMLNKAKTKFKAKNIKFVKAYIEKLPFKKNSFDTACFIRTIHHLKKPSLALQEASRVLKPSGWLILEFANKLHFKTRLKAWLRLDFKFSCNTQPVKIGQSKNCDVPFLNYHPQFITQLLEKNNFQIIKKFSVSNFRSSFCKKILPFKWLLFLENIAQEALAGFCAGPSIFILAKKK